MKERKFGLGVLICILNKDFSKILLLKRNEEKRKKDGAEWGHVGGRIEFGEKIIDAGIREAKEEIGINLNPKRLKFIKIIENPNLTDIFHAIHFVYATIMEETEKIVIDSESEDYGWFDIDKLPEKRLDSKEDTIEIVDIAKKLLK